MSHHRNDPGVDREEGEDRHLSCPTAHRTFLKRLQATPDGDGSLLDHSLILYGGGMGDGNLHRHFDLPCLIGRASWAGKFKTGTAHRLSDNTPMSNLLLTILDKAGAHIDKLGDSTAPLSL